MTYLLDVNALLALLFAHHEFHVSAEKWIAANLGDSDFGLATCPITELGFVRVASGVALFGVNLHEAKSLLTRFKKNRVLKPRFFPDSLSACDLPDWAKKSAHTTDGYLSQLAERHDARLATFDQGIPGAFLIPR